MLALLTFDGSRGTRVMGKFQRRKGTGKDPTWRLKQRFPPLLSQSNCFFHQLRICCPLWPNHIAPSFSNVFGVACWANQTIYPVSCVLASLAKPIKLLLPSALYLASLTRPIKLLLPSAVYLQSSLSQSNQLLLLSTVYLAPLSEPITFASGHRHAQKIFNTVLFTIRLISRIRQQ